MSDPTDAPERLPPSLTLLKWLVIGLTASLIAGVIAVVWLLVTRLPVPMATRTPALPSALPPELALPPGTTAEAVTLGHDWIAVVTGDDRILIFRPDGSLRQEIRITQ